MTGARPLAGFALVAALAACVATPAATPRTRVDPVADLLRGRLDGVAVSADGSLFAAPSLERMTATEGGPLASHAWSLAADGAGSVYLGTGPDGRILRVSPSTGTSVRATLDAPLVTALLVLPDGTLIAGASPDARVFRIPYGGSPEVLAELDARYVWDLARGSDGRLYAATGEPGGVVRISERGEVATWYESTDPHVVALAALPDGGLIAGGAGRGTIVRLDREGRPTVLHDDDLPEVADLAVLPGGDVVAALVAPPPVPSRRPAVRIELPGDPRFAGATGIDTLEEAPGTVVEGFIEGLAGEDREPAAALRGKIVRIGADGIAREIWRSSTEAPFVVAVDSRGRARFGTGEPARLYGIEDGHVALLASLDEGQTTGLIPFGPGLILATSNPAAAFRIDEDRRDAGVFLSATFDAGAPARWGSIRWRADRFPNPVEMFTRTGDCAEPDASWSAWSPALTDPRGSDIVNPDGRFVQWRLRIPPGAGGSAVRVSDVRVTYEPRNRPPEVRDPAFVDGGPAVRATATVSWTARDADADPLHARVDVRSADGGDWRTLVRVPDEPPAREPSEWRVGRVSIDVGGLDEGTWDLRVAVDDVAGNVPGEERETATVERISMVVDRTPPTVTVSAAGSDAFRVEAKDAGSGLRAAVVLSDGEVAFRARPDDGVCDDAAETFTIRLPEAFHGRTLQLRLEDAAGNVASVDLRP